MEMEPVTCHYCQEKATIEINFLPVCEGHRQRRLNTLKAEPVISQYTHPAGFYQDKYSLIPIDEDTQ